VEVLVWPHGLSMLDDACPDEWSRLKSADITNRWAEMVALVVGFSGVHKVLKKGEHCNAFNCRYVLC